ncbi:hypothetical protein Tco_0892145 [Tanacetum coccineum]|uniref:Uncharacterized protein n=1 Tax=Tanacetum coccineum TaxID=301880 RepID=A0ABQ5C6F8_9ASTR
MPDEPLAVPLDGLHVDDKLFWRGATRNQMIVKLYGVAVTLYSESRIPLVKVRWNSKQGPEFTWEREDKFRKKYPHLFANPVAVDKFATPISPRGPSSSNRETIPPRCLGVI